MYWYRQFFFNMDVSSPANWNSGGSVMNAFIPSVRLMPFRVPPCRRCPRRRTLSRLSLVSPVSSVHFYSVLSSIAHLHLLSLHLFFPSNMSPLISLLLCICNPHPPYMDRYFFYAPESPTSTVFFFLNFLGSFQLKV